MTDKQALEYLEWYIRVYKHTISDNMLKALTQAVKALREK